jgi:hypothetical protein
MNLRLAQQSTPFNTEYTEEEQRQTALAFAKDVGIKYADRDNDETQYFRRGDQYLSYQEDKECWFYNAKNDEVVYRISLKSDIDLDVDEVDIIDAPDTTDPCKASFERNKCIDLDLADAVETIITDNQDSERQALDEAYEKFFSACKQDSAMTNEDWQKVLPKYADPYEDLQKLSSRRPNQSPSMFDSMGYDMIDILGSGLKSCITESVRVFSFDERKRI